MKSNILFFLLLCLSCSGNVTEKTEEKDKQKAMILANKLDIFNSTYFDDPKDSLCKNKYLDNEWCITKYLKIGDTVNISLYSVMEIKNNIYCIGGYEHICEIVFINDILLSINYALPNFESVNFEEYIENNKRLISKQKEEIFLKRNIDILDCYDVVK